MKLRILIETSNEEWAKEWAEKYGTAYIKCTDNNPHKPFMVLGTEEQLEKWEIMLVNAKKIANR